jgi:hypothetical protein
MGKQMSYGSKSAAIHPLKCLYGGTQKTNLPLLDY